MTFLPAGKSANQVLVDQVDRILLHPHDRHVHEAQFGRPICVLIRVQPDKILRIGERVVRQSPQQGFDAGRSWPGAST